jgi:hypothetical protein
MMMHRKAALTTVVAAFLLLTASPAWADLRASWQMNETSGQMIDSSSYGNHSSAPTSEDPDGDGVVNVARDGNVYTFNGSNSYVRVPDTNSSLDPVDKDITITAHVMVNGTTISDDSYDIVRKGLGTTAGGDYKMELKRIKRDPNIAKLNCVFRGTTNVKRLAAPNILAQPGWHTFQCIRTATHVRAVVDGVTYSKRATTGPIANDADILVGAKTPTDDVLNGSIDFITIDIAA